MSYGTNGSVIGPDNVPTASVASGVWSPAEVAEARRDEIWPMPPVLMEFIAKHVADGSTATYDFTSIPQTYRDLRLVISKANNTTSSSRLFIQLDIGSGVDTTAGNYGDGMVYSGNSTSGTMIGVVALGYWGFWQTDDFPYTTTDNNSAFMIDIPRYTDSAQTTDMIGWQNPRSTTSALGNSAIGSLGHIVAGAVSGIRVTRETTSSGYEWASPTTFTLFGIGTP